MVAESLSDGSKPNVPSAQLSSPGQPKRARGRRPKARRSVCAPLHVTDTSGADVDLRPFVIGCAMLGVEPKPQQIRVAVAVLAGLQSQTAVCIPRRSGKTVALWACVLGLCVTRSDFVVIFTAQTGLKARERWLQTVETLERRGQLRGAEVRRASGQERLTWPANGSRLLVVSPKAESFRGEDSDLVWLDEAQEFDADESRDLVAGIAPTQDTRPGAQIIVSGTAGPERAGVLWDWLELGRSGRGGIVEYAAPDTLDADDPATWLVGHPGLAYGMTTLQRITDRHAGMDADTFAREYLGRWPLVHGTHLISPDLWQRLGSLEYAERPDRGEGVIFGLDCDTGQRWASVVAVWRTGDRVSVELIKASPGIDWVSRHLYGLSRTYPDARFVWDGMPANVAATQPLDRARPKPKSDALGFRDMKDAAAGLLLAVESERLQHFHQPELDAAAGSAVARVVGDGWLLQRSLADVTSLVAVSAALHQLDRTKTRRRVSMAAAS